MISVIVNKLLTKREASSFVDTTSLEYRVSLAKIDEPMRNELIKQYQPFILKVTSKVCKQYIDQQRDEFSVALQAYNEAIDHYQSEQGSSFLSFAEMVIRRRVIDYIRKESRQTRDIYLEVDSYEEEEVTESLAQVSASMVQYNDSKENEIRKADIQDYQKRLKDFDITFAELTTLCPKHIDARENAKQIAQFLAKQPALVEHLVEKKQLPMKELLKSVRCSRKTIERNRKYIIAMVLIYIGDFRSLRTYIEPEQELNSVE